MYGNRTRIALIDNQVPHQSAYTAKWSTSGDSTPISAFGALRPVRLDDRPKPWYGYEDSNLNLNVRSVLSCPLNDTREKLAGRPGLEPGTSAFRARRAAKLRQRPVAGGDRIERPKPASKAGGLSLTEPPF